MVGEGVLIESLRNNAVESILSVSRRSAGYQHPKLKELIVPDFMLMKDAPPEFKEYDACFYCAGISSIGMKEDEYKKITYDTTMHFGQVVKNANPNIVFNHLSGAQADSSETGRAMWARVKGKTENDLQKLFPGKAYNFRPGLMKPFPEQKHLYGYNRWLARLAPVLGIIFPTLNFEEIGRAMIQTARNTETKSVLEVQDIKRLARSFS
jgi:hypothetical protein